MNRIIVLLIISFTGLCFTCRRMAPTLTQQKEVLIFLDSLEALKAITMDDAEGFFKHINATDIAIQMKRNLRDLGQDPVNTYIDFLKSEVVSFNTEDKENLTRVWSQVLKQTHAVNGRINLPVQLVKIKTRHYGENVFYTRGNTIFIPENVLTQFNASVLHPIMLHEWWHILSERYPDLRDSIYLVFGFKKHNLSLKFPEKLKNRLLTNPDGADLSYAIPIEGGQWLMPIIFSVGNEYLPQKLNFMGHLQMEVVKIKQDGIIEYPSNPSTADQAREMEVFFNKIGDNTQYIIHPDEIAADNFMLALIAYSENNFAKFSQDGRKKVERLIEIMKKVK